MRMNACIQQMGKAKRTGQQPCVHGSLVQMNRFPCAGKQYAGAITVSSDKSVF